DYRAAKLLGISTQSVYQWKRGTTMSDEVGILVATELGLDPAKVLVDLQIERGVGELACPVWRQIRERLGMALAPAVVGFMGYAAGALLEVPMI
ncbi:hypothetical protein, partial [Halomonas campaniensis]|uniref:hypothetical protein n=1 Tax=Halomonas campaniensis TaxID=213554 RepID=UPI003970BC7C